MNARTNLALRREPTTQSTSPLVLVVEDDESLRGRLVAALREDDYEVFEAANDADAIEFLAGPLPFPDVIVLEVRMPVVSGLELLARWRRHDWATPVILFDRFGSDGIDDEARRLGAITVLKAPCALDQVRATVAGVVNNVAETA